MKQRQREQVQRGCAVGTVVLLAWLCRVLPLEGLPSGLQEACGILRSLLYLSLFAGWGISLYNRTVHPQVRRLLLNVDMLMLFWIIVRTLRFQLNTPPGMDRMLGYLYYAPMLGIPVLCVQLVLTVDRSERYRLSAWARMLWLPSAVLLELVLTNDLHQQVFRLQQPWNENYQYGWLFGLVVGWIVICILLAFGIIAHKSRNPRILRRLPLPAIPLVLLGVYAVLYGLHIPLIRQFLGDMTIVHCLMTAASLEGGLRCGLIQSNTGYEELLRVTSLAVQLVDRQGNVYCCSENGRMVDRRVPDQVPALVIGSGTGIGQHQGDSFGQIHTGAATNANNSVRHARAEALHLGHQFIHIAGLGFVIHVDMQEQIAFFQGKAGFQRGTGKNPIQHKNHA